MSKKVTVLYHADCVDGFTAAWAAWRQLKDTANYIPVKYYTDPPWDLINKQDVYILDFAYPYDVMVEIKKRATTALCLDHHASVSGEVKHLSWVLYDNKHSGAHLAWTHFNPGSEIPKLVSYVEDRDLWNWELQDSRELNTYLMTKEFSFRMWEYLNEDIVRQHGEWRACGKAILAYQHIIQTYHLRDLETFKIPYGNEFMVATVRGCNATVLHSELGNDIAELDTMGLLWTERADGTIKISLRSIGAKDISKIAKHYGGGGHANAAGCQVDRKTFDSWRNR